MKGKTKKIKKDWYQTYIIFMTPKKTQATAYGWGATQQKSILKACADVEKILALQ